MNFKGDSKFQIPFIIGILYQKVLQYKKTNPKLYFHSSAEELRGTPKKSDALQYLEENMYISVDCTIILHFLFCKLK